MHNPCALIPVYNHEAAVPAVVHSLLNSGLPCLLVDDGSSPACAAVLAQLATLDNVTLLTLPNNQGKGGAVMAGFREAVRRGFTHALQVDADGQHDLREVEGFLDTSRRHPDAVICGYPEYDDSVPKGRLYARYLTHVWVWINTLSLQIRDSMCGFRVYPLAPTLALMNSAYIGTRMDFDSDILVRLAWRNQPMRWLPTQVHYPADGLSHFRLFRDKRAHLGHAHAAVFRHVGARADDSVATVAGMSERTKHWADREERGSFWLMKLTAVAARVLGRRLLSPLLYSIVLYFFLFGRTARLSAWEYQQRLADWSGRDELRPTHKKVFGQFMAFADSLLDKLDVWNGKLRLEQIEINDPAQLRGQLRGERGQMLVGAHLGNLEVCRALAEIGEQVTMNVLVHTKHAERFNRLLGEAGATHLRLIQVSELDPATMLLLSQRLDDGEWLAIAGDRVPLHGGRKVRVDFLGFDAAFPQGPWLLAGLLKCPVNLLMCLKHNGRYRLTIEPFAQLIEWKRSTREQVIALWTARYAARLGQFCLEAPQQWFNFYPFWKTDDDAS